jgi:hypothetical protein
MTETRKLRIFLSYAHADIAPIRGLYQELINKGYDVWLDEENLIPGQEWEIEIEKALRNSDVILVCLSINSVSKEGFVQKEFRYALDKALEMTEGGIFLIPVRLANCDVPTKLSRFHWVDLFMENGMERLGKALTLRLKQVNERDFVSTSETKFNEFGSNDQRIRNRSTLGAANNQRKIKQDVYLETPIENIPSLWKAIGFHILFGFGMFYVDNKAARRWIYPIFPIYAVIDYILGMVLIVKPFDSTEFGAYTFILALGIYLFSFRDVIVSFKRLNK